MLFTANIFQNTHETTSSLSSQLVLMHHCQHQPSFDICLLKLWLQHPHLSIHHAPFSAMWSEKRRHVSDSQLCTDAQQIFQQNIFSSGRSHYHHETYDIRRRQLLGVNRNRMLKPIHETVQHLQCPTDWQRFGEFTRNDRQSQTKQHTV